MKKMFILIMAVVVLLPVASKASKVKIQIWDGVGPNKGISHIKITKGPANQPVDVKANKGKDKIDVCSGETDNNGTFEQSGLDKSKTKNSQSLEVTIDSETWKGVTIGGIEYTSEEQKTKAFDLENFDILPFEPFGSFFIVDGDRYGQVQVINFDTNFAYKFSELLMYVNLDKSYFNAEDFDSPEAIATGQLVFDVIAEMGEVGMEPGVAMMNQAANNLITVPSGMVNDTERYELLIGIAHKVDDDGNPIGPDIGFSIGIIPEPATSMLLALGGLALLRRRTRAT